MNKFSLIIKLICLILGGVFFSCVDSDNPLEIRNIDLLKINDTRSPKTNKFSFEKDSAMMEFAKILSKVTYENRDVREFLKIEALKRFDMNTDVLYVAVKDKKISERTFREVLKSYSSEETITAIENAVPLLNILLPSIAIFDINVENMDCNDEEIPVAIEDEKGMTLFLNGDVEMTIPFGELPSFYTIVVNENNKVIVESETRASNVSYRFKSPNYDKEFNEEIETRSFTGKVGDIVGKSIGAYTYFHENSGLRSMALQRDYVYYDLTPDNNKKGTYDHRIREYLKLMEVDPKAYFKIADINVPSTGEDPHIINGSVTRKAVDFTEQELVNLMWSQGTYDFRFEVYSSNSSFPNIVYVSLRPEELWNFNLTRDYRHSTAFRHSKYTYTIDPNKFTSKLVWLKGAGLDLGKWNLSQEGLERYIKVYEEDSGTKVTKVSEHEVTEMMTNKVNGDIKFGLGTGIEGTVGTEFNHSTTKRERKQVMFEYCENDDALGAIKMYFYDPIIEARHNQGVDVFTYSTGIVKFAIIPQ